MSVQAKPCDEWTEDEVGLMMAWEAEKMRRAEREAAVKSEGAAYSRAYAEKLRRMDEAEQEGSLGWFLRELGRNAMPHQVRVEKPEEQVREYLAAAYRRRVESVGMIYLPDAYTDRALSDVSRWLTCHVKSGMMLRGYIGTGKTTMMLAVRDVLKITQKLTLEVKDAREIANAGRNGGDAYLKELAGLPLLGIDDLGTEPQTVKNYGNDLSPVAELLTERYNRRLFTIITTNLAVKTGEDGVAVDELKEVYGERLYDRFLEQYNTISYDSGQPSYRGR